MSRLSLVGNRRVGTALLSMLILSLGIFSAKFAKAGAETRSITLRSRKITGRPQSAAQTTAQNIVQSAAQNTAPTIGQSAAQSDTQSKSSNVESPMDNEARLGHFPEMLDFNQLMNLTQNQREVYIRSVQAMLVELSANSVGLSDEARRHVGMLDLLLSEASAQDRTGGVPLARFADLNRAAQALNQPVRGALAPTAPAAPVAAAPAPVSAPAPVVVTQPREAPPIAGAPAIGPAVVAPAPVVQPIGAVAPPAARTPPVGAPNTTTNTQPPAPSAPEPGGCRTEPLACQKQTREQRRKDFETYVQTGTKDCIFAGNRSSYIVGTKRCTPVFEVSITGLAKPLRCVQPNVICNPLIFGVKGDVEHPEALCVKSQMEATRECESKSSTRSTRAFLEGKDKKGSVFPLAESWNQLKDFVNSVCGKSEKTAEFHCVECNVIMKRLSQANVGKWSNGKVCDGRTFELGTLSNRPTRAPAPTRGPAPATVSH